MQINWTWRGVGWWRRLLIQQWRK